MKRYGKRNAIFVGTGLRSDCSSAINTKDFRQIYKCFNTQKNVYIACIALPFLFLVDTLESLLRASILLENYLLGVKRLFLARSQA